MSQLCEQKQYLFHLKFWDSVKMRQKQTSNKDKSNAQNELNQKTIEDDLKWVEENVPATLIET
jgi:hypothetical protein